MDERVVLVNSFDEVVGETDKLQAHIDGALHRAFSVFVFNSEGKLLLQKRASTKYHSKSLWSNTCCGHPRPREDTSEAAHRRLKEEMGIDCELREVFCFTYRAVLDSNLIEHEFDHVFIGVFDGEPILNEKEGEDWMWTGIESLQQNIALNPEMYSFWLQASIQKVINHYETSRNEYETLKMIRRE